MKAMAVRFEFAFFTTLSVLVAQILVADLAATASTFDRSTQTPDLMQTDPQAALPDGGREYCGPVAAADAIVWLSKNGFPSLTTSKAEDAKTVGALALTLAEKMKTTITGGTVPSGFLPGLEKYVAEKGYVGSLQYQGWEKYPKRFDGGSELPQLNFIRRGLLSNSNAMWLKIGWYRYFPNEDKYVRFAGHWVTVVGMIDSPESNELTLLIHDPAARSGISPRHEAVTLSRIQSGKLITGYNGMTPRDASGFFKLGGELKIKSKADFGLLDGVAVLSLRHQN